MAWIFYDQSARNFVSSSSCEQTVTEPTHIDGGVFALVLTDVPDVVAVRVGSLVETTDQGAVYIDVLELPIPRQLYK